jgi:hypothetical protein
MCAFGFEMLEGFERLLGKRKLVVTPAFGRSVFVEPVIGSFLAVNSLKVQQPEPKIPDKFQPST